jgi:hypothetical protein
MDNPKQQPKPNQQYTYPPTNLLLNPPESPNTPTNTPQKTHQQTTYNNPQTHTTQQNKTPTPKLTK